MANIWHIYGTHNGTQMALIMALIMALRWHSEGNHTFELEVPPLTLTRRGRNDESGELCSLAYT